MLLALSLFAYMFLQSCGDNGNPADPNKDNYKFLYIALDTTAHSKLIEYGIEKAKVDYPNVTFTAVYPNQNGNVQEQIAFVQKAVAEGYGGIIIVPASESLLTADFDEAFDKHVPVVILENPTNYPDYVAKIATDNYDAGRSFADYLKTIYTGSGKVLIVSDDAQNKNNASRVYGFVQQLGNSNFQGTFITPNVYHTNNYTSALNKITTIINNNPELGVIYATNGVGLTAAANAVKALNKINIFVIGFDNSAESISMLQNSDINAMGVTYPAEMGYKAMEQMINHKKGSTVTRIISPGMMIVTKANFNTEAAQKALYPKGK